MKDTLLFLFFLSLVIIGNVYNFRGDLILCAIGGFGAGYKLIDVITYFIDRIMKNKDKL